MLERSHSPWICCVGGANLVRASKDVNYVPFGCAILEVSGLVA